MLVLTGREARTLPPPVVRGLIWRAYVDRALPLIALARQPIPVDASVQAKLDRAELVKVAAKLEASIFDG